METMTARPVAKLEDEYRSDPVKACRKALRLTRGVDEYKRLDVCNDLLGLYGTEAIRGAWQNGPWCDVVAHYCNTGESYAVTIVKVRGDTRFDNARYVVTSWGDFVERNTKRYGLV